MYREETETEGVRDVDREKSGDPSQVDVLKEGCSIVCQGKYSPPSFENCLEVYREEAEEEGVREVDRVHFRCRANSAHIRPSRPDFGLEFQ